MNPVTMIGDGPRTLTEYLAKASGPPPEPMVEKRLPQARQFWPSPDRPYAEGQAFIMEIDGGAILRCETSAKSNKVLVSAMVQDHGDVVLFRFLMPNHNRTVREWFKAVGIKAVPHQNWAGTVAQGMFLVSFVGMVIGEDNLPPNVPNTPRSIYVLQDVVMRTYIPPVVAEPPPQAEAPPVEEPAPTLDLTANPTKAE